MDESEFHQCDWSEFYPGAKETIDPDAPEPLGKSVITSCFVDADHAGELLARRSRIGHIVLLNNAPIYWFSKKIVLIETSTFGSEFMAMK